MKIDMASDAEIRQLYDQYRTIYWRLAGPKDGSKRKQPKEAFLP